ncbi:hypothetical protein BDP27DRAFT_1320554 [Rhodocollybia butyracea]|uniref:MYND-type domain-containing protein n=1 Tax=Rhodocollybia butyracea TaxID=206335 RepID=A0A9P5UBV2_9AGAR|nr:hypothetical protein BDP27DRAFT_1320554 [Rhodocollybia butyracea]
MSLDEVDFQTKILIIIPELTVYLDLAVAEAVGDKIRNVLKEDFGPLLDLAVRTWIYVLDNCSRDTRDRVGDVLEQMPGSEHIILRSIVQELQLPMCYVENLWFALDVILGCARHHDTMFERFLDGGMVRWLCWSFKRMTLHRLLDLEISNDNEYLQAIATCVHCLEAAFIDSYNWIPLAISYDFLKAVIQSGPFIAKRRSTLGGVALEESLHMVFETMKPFLLYRSVLRPFLWFVKSAQRLKPELYRQLIDMPPNTEYPDICFPTTWKGFVTLAEERQESRRTANKEGEFICSNLDCSLDSTNAKLKQCSCCRAILYCSKKCQKSDWSEHREECEMLRSRAISGGRPAPWSQFDQDFFTYLTEDCGRRLLTSPQFRYSLEIDSNGFGDKIITLDFRKNPPIMHFLTFEQYLIDSQTSNSHILTAENYDELVEETKTGYTLLLQGIFPGEDGIPESVVTSVVEDDYDLD